MSLKSVLSSRSIQNIANISNKLDSQKDAFGGLYDSKDVDSITEYANKCMIENKERVSELMSLIGSFTGDMNLGETWTNFYKYFIDNPTAQDKIRFIQDGSFYDVRVWIYANPSKDETQNTDLRLVIDIPRDGHTYSSAPFYSTTEALKHIDENYEYIPVQLPTHALEDMKSFKQYIQREVDMSIAMRDMNHAIMDSR